MNEIKNDLNMMVAKKNTDKLVCMGCQEITIELYSLNIDGKQILMCSDCKEALTAKLESEDVEVTVSYINTTYNNIITGYIKNESSGSDVLIDKIRYTKDHIDC